MVGETSTFKYMGVGYLVFPKGTAKADVLKLLSLCSAWGMLFMFHYHILVGVVSFGFSQAWVVGRPRVVAALAICLLIPTSRDRLMLELELRYVN